MDLAALKAYVGRYPLATLATLSPDGPQAAVVGFAVNDALELVFDTLDSTRKYRNLQQDARVALVIGGGDEKTLQYEGVAAELSGAELKAYRELYFHSFPDGRERLNWSGITWFRISPQWLRYSDYGKSPPLIEEMRWPL